MTPITWLSCLAGLSIIVVDTEADTVNPFVIASYPRKYDVRRTKYVDLEDATDENLKLPLDDAKPEKLVLFCATKKDGEENSLLVEQLQTEEINSRAKEIKCDNQPLLPSIIHQQTTNDSLFAYIGYYISGEFTKQEHIYTIIYMDKIKYNYKHKVLEYIKHKVVAHMHSNTYEKKCEKIRINTLTVKSKEYKLDTLHDIQVPGYKWRQLVPMQDFKGIYATETTCTYLNYLLLHEKAIESLKRIEIFMREVADVIGEVYVESGTYTPKQEVLLLGNEPNQTIIPSIVWKQITHRGGQNEYYRILVVIHNKTTKKICEHDKDIEKMELPNDDEKSENNIGYMYYCFYEEETWKLLNIPTYYGEVEKPLNLKNLPFEEDNEQMTIDVISKIKENKQATSNTPLVMAVYRPKYHDEVPITLADLIDVNDENLKLPLNGVEPLYFVIFCATLEGSLKKYSLLNKQRITEKINSRAEMVQCEHHPLLPSIVHYTTMNESIMAYTGYYISSRLSKQEIDDIESSTDMRNFEADYKYILEHECRFVEYLESIKYNYKHNIPVSIKHTVKAHMHSNTYEKKCEEIGFNTFTEENKEYRLDTLHDISVPGYEWRQLVPMQDFKGIYGTKATCTYLNYLLLHKKTIESLEKIENFIRDVADVINEVRVKSGTYTPEQEVLLLGNEPNQTIIPSIVWKQITHRGGQNEYYRILVVIHNKTTKKICEHDKDIEKMELPNDDEKSENNIGYMYYCFYEKETWKLLNIPTYYGEVEKPLNLKNLPFEKGNEKKTIDVISKIKENKLATSNTLLVMAVYTPKYNDERRITFVDLIDVNDENLKLPLNGVEPLYFVIFCATLEGSLKKYLLLNKQRMTEIINSRAEMVQCEHHPFLPSIVYFETINESIMAYTGYYISSKLSKQEIDDTESSTDMRNFEADYKNILEHEHRFVKYLEDIKYNYKYNIPVSIKHTVKAHMHSNTYEKKCEEIRFDTFTEENEKYRLDTLHSIQAPGYEWRQLVPMQDFKGIYGTKATCTYLNYLLLHKKTIESLEKIENFIRDVADVINEVRVESGTYTPKQEVLLLGNKPNQIIPSIVWKRITHRGSLTDYYTVLVVIHNTKTERICEHNKDTEKLGLPKYNKKNKNDRGYTYYCLFNKEISRLLQINFNESQVLNPLNLNELPYEKGDEKEFINVKSKIKENKQASSRSAEKWPRNCILTLSCLSG